jgi:hypothetical protein
VRLLVKDTTITHAPTVCTLQVLVIGFASGEIPKIAANIALVRPCFHLLRRRNCFPDPVKTVQVKNLTVHGVFWGSYLMYNPDVIKASIEVQPSGFPCHASHQNQLKSPFLIISQMEDRVDEFSQPSLMHAGAADLASGRSNPCGGASAHVFVGAGAAGLQGAHEPPGRGQSAHRA